MEHKESTTICLGKILQWSELVLKGKLSIWKISNKIAGAKIHYPQHAIASYSIFVRSRWHGGATQIRKIMRGCTTGFVSISSASCWDVPTMQRHLLVHWNQKSSGMFHSPPGTLEPLFHLLEHCWPNTNIVQHKHGWMNKTSIQQTKHRTKRSSRTKHCSPTKRLFPSKTIIKQNTQHFWTKHRTPNSVHRTPNAVRVQSWCFKSNAWASLIWCAAPHAAIPPSAFNAAKAPLVA